MSDDREYLVDRVRALDTAADPASDSATRTLGALSDNEAGDEVSRDVNAFIRVLRRVFYVEGVRIPVINAHDADAIVATSRLLARLGADAPQIVSGSLDRCSQYWISTEKFAWLKHVIHQANPLGLFGRDHLSTEAQLVRQALSAEPCQPLRSAVAGNDAQFHFRLTQFRAAAGQPNRTR